MARHLTIVCAILVSACAPAVAVLSNGSSAAASPETDLAAFRAVVNYLPTLVVEGLELRVDPNPLRPHATGGSDSDFADVPSSVVASRASALRAAGVRLVSITDRDTCSGRNGMPPAPLPPGVPTEQVGAERPTQGPFECAAIGLVRSDTASGPANALVRVYLVAPGQWTLVDVELTVDSRVRVTVKGSKIIHRIVS
jgi:hypothetical protein